MNLKKFKSIKKAVPRDGSPSETNYNTLASASLTTPKDYLSNIWHIYEKCMAYIPETYAIHLKDFTKRGIGFVVDKLLDFQLEMSEEEQPELWSVYFLNTKTHIAIIATRGSLGDFLPEDGSFINGIMVKDNLTEDSARSLAEELQGKVKP